MMFGLHQSITLPDIRTLKTSKISQPTRNPQKMKVTFCTSASNKKRVKKHTQSLIVLNPSTIAKKYNNKKIFIRKVPSSYELPSRLDILAAPPVRHRIHPVHHSMVNISMKKLPLLVAIKPDNERAEKERFMKTNYNYNPYFLYRGIADPDSLKKFKAPSDQYLSLAVLILESTLAYFGSYETFDKVTGGPILNKQQIYSLCKSYLASEDLDEEVQINLKEDLLSRGSMTRTEGRPVVNIRCVNLREHGAEGLLRHEIGTHYLRSCNNSKQPWSNPKVRENLNMKPFNPTEEGLASLHSVLLRDKPFLWQPALLYYTTFKASKMSFKEIFIDLEKYVQSPHVRWDCCLRAKRGQVDTSRPGGFFKDQVYLEGVLKLLKRRKTLDFELLVRLGKVSFEDVGRSCLTENAKLDKTRIPKFMEDMVVYHRQLDYIAKTNGLTDDVLNLVD
ncbi:microtubule-associated tyrosine carboxypeptidase-like [Physella acuta]|uniref:microtubule-associated tyrosine carboxypeptidase-like n=1 Tax=Physella acuta TaxID=109671 RepID=UPI0027DC664B|nr:microtubule-associated tyrosine carboxypeptidase-like [Physella acuta]